MARKWAGTGIAFILTLLFAFWMNYLLLPAWTLSSGGLWGYFILVLSAGCAFFSIANAVTSRRNGARDFAPTIAVALLTALLLIAGCLASITSWKLTSSRAYKNSVQVSENGAAQEDLPRVASERDIPAIDMITARQLGDRTMGSMAEFISQYEVDGEYNMILYQGKPYRISPLLYGGFFKYLSNRDHGIPGYVLVDIYTQKSTLERLENPIQYSPSASFGHKLKRHLRGLYPTCVFGKEQFEIDDNGTPYYVVPVLSPTVGLFGARAVSKVLLVNAVTGEAGEYMPEQVPEWVDHVYGVAHVMERVGWYYAYGNGYWNTVFANRGVRKTSYSFDDTQYFFFPRGNDIYLYTGITSSGKDESNIGFVLCNVRTGDIVYYASAGAEESSAQASAQGAVQHLGYAAGAVMLCTVDGIETYYMALKDNSNLVKMHALVNKQTYTIVSVEASFDRAIAAYRAKLRQDANEQVSGRIEELYTAIIEGNTYFFFVLEGDPGRLYRSSIANGDSQIRMNIGDYVEALCHAGVDATAAYEVSGITLPK